MPITPVSAAAAAAPITPATTPPSRSFGSVLEARGAGAPGPPGPGRPAALPAALADLDRARGRLDAVLQAARGGKTFTAQELLGLQAEAYRYAQTVELAAKVVEGAAQSVKQAVNTQL